MQSRVQVGDGTWRRSLSVTLSNPSHGGSSRVDGTTITLNSHAILGSFSFEFEEQKTKKMKLKVAAFALIQVHNNVLETVTIICMRSVLGDDFACKNRQRAYDSCLLSNGSHTIKLQVEAVSGINAGSRIHAG